MPVLQRCGAHVGSRSGGAAPSSDVVGEEGGEGGGDELHLLDKLFPSPSSMEEDELKSEAALALQRQKRSQSLRHRESAAGGLPAVVTGAGGGGAATGAGGGGPATGASGSDGSWWGRAGDGSQRRRREPLGAGRRREPAAATSASGGGAATGAGGGDGSRWGRRSDGSRRRRREPVGARHGDWNGGLIAFYF
nr:circumsporozoite protein-like [Aegilops tauschii subsp. strangulata]